MQSFWAFAWSEKEEKEAEQEAEQEAEPWKLGFIGLSHIFESI